MHKKQNKDHLINQLEKSLHIAGENLAEIKAEKKNAEHRAKVDSLMNDSSLHEIKSINVESCDECGKLHLIVEAYNKFGAPAISTLTLPASVMTDFLRKIANDVQQAVYNESENKCEGPCAEEPERKDRIN